LKKPVVPLPSAGQRTTWMPIARLLMRFCSGVLSIACTSSPHLFWLSVPTRIIFHWKANRFSSRKSPVRN